MKYQPPVYSPLTLGGIGAGLRAALGGNARREQLEALLATSFQAERVVLTRSGTHALQIALSTLADGGPDAIPIALPGYSCFDLVTAAAATGVRVRFYDVDPVTLSPDLASLQRLLDDGVSCVVAGNLYGFPLDFAPLRKMCDAAGVPIIEDAAQGVGSHTGQGRTGSLGDASVLSFGRGKGWTGGGGGAVLFRGNATRELSPPPLDEVVASGFRSGVVTLVAWSLGRPVAYRLPASIPWLGLGTTQYHEPERARTITAFSTRLALETAEGAFAAPGERRLVAEEWTRRLAKSTELTPCQPLGGSDHASFLRYPVVASSPERAAALAHSTASLGVARGYPVALHQLPQGIPLQVRNDRPLPASERLASCLLTLPTHHWTTTSVMDRVIRAATLP